MKIVFLAPFGIRPKGTVIARMLPLAAELQQLGHVVTIVAPPYTNLEDSGKTETVRGVRLVNVALPSGGKALSAPLLAWRMYKAALAEKPELIHLFKPKGYGGLAVMLMTAFGSLGLRIPPLFVDTDDWEGKGGMNESLGYSRMERVLFRFQESWLLPRMRGVTVASRTLQTQAWGMGISPDRVRYLPNGVEGASCGDGAKIREKLGIVAGTPVVLLYTRFFEFDQRRLHDLFAEIHTKRPDARLLVVGKGRKGEEEQLMAAALEKGFHDALIIAGWVEPGELPNYFAAADVAIYPFADTLVNRAKCPAKLTELLRAGVPVVADGVGQIAEYIRPEVSGILCDPDDDREMASRVMELLADSARRRALGEAGRERLLSHFAWKDLAVELAEFYQHCGCDR